MLATIENDERAFYIQRSTFVPVADADRDKIEAFIAGVASSFRSSDRDYTIREVLTDRLLGQRGSLPARRPTVDAAVPVRPN